MAQRVDRFLGWVVQALVGVFGLVILFVLGLFLLAVFLVFIGDRLS
jgi:hypothetical protein